LNEIKEGNIMGTVINKSMARDLVDKNGVDVDKLIDRLVNAAVTELANYYYYTILRLSLLGVEGEAFKKIIEDIRREDRNHFEALVPRIYELGGTLPNITEFNHQRVSLHNSTIDSSNIRVLLATLLKSVESAVWNYTEICNITCGKDNRTYALALAISHEKIRHQIWFLEFFGRGLGEPSGNAAGQGNSPFVSKFLEAGNNKLQPVNNLV
jgi:ferritin-like protein